MGKLERIDVRSHTRDAIDSSSKPGEKCPITLLRVLDTLHLFMLQKIAEVLILDASSTRNPTKYRLSKALPISFRMRTVLSYGDTEKKLFSHYSHRFSLLCRHAAASTLRHRWCEFWDRRCGSSSDPRPPRLAQYWAAKCDTPCKISDPLRNCILWSHPRVINLRSRRQFQQKSHEGAVYIQLLHWVLHPWEMNDKCLWMWWIDNRNIDILADT